MKVIDYIEAKPRLKRLFDSLFSEKDFVDRDGMVYPLRWRTSRNKRLRHYKIKGYTIIEQNPNTRTEFAELARQGNKIMWIIPPSYSGEHWICVIERVATKTKCEKDDEKK